VGIAHRPVYLLFLLVGIAHPTTTQNVPFSRLSNQGYARAAERRTEASTMLHTLFLPDWERALHAVFQWNSTGLRP